VPITTQIFVKFRHLPFSLEKYAMRRLPSKQQRNLYMLELVGPMVPKILKEGELAQLKSYFYWRY